MSDTHNRRLAAIVATDVADYSRLTGLDEEGTITRLRSYRRELIDPALVQHRGRVANTAGDSLLIEFPSVVDAVRCAISIQEGMESRTASEPEDRRIALRIGVHVGDVVAEGKDLLGEGVNIAARIEAICRPGSILLSDAAHSQVRDRIDHIWQDAGEHTVKNIARPVRVWGWTEDAAAATAGSSDDRPSIAVLAFNNMSGDPEQTYFAEGIAEDIITDLSKVSGLFVIARNSSFAYRDRSPDIRKVCRELGVRYVLEGSVRKGGNRVRINAQLIEGANGGHVWADRFDRDLADIFAVQDEVTAEIVTALKVHLTPTERDQRHGRGQVDPEAYDLWLKGRQLVYRFRADAMVEAREHLTRALQIAPDMARAHTVLALVEITEYMNGWNGAGPDRLDRGLALARRAIDLDPDDAENWHAFALANLRLSRNDEAERAARKAVELNANFAGGMIALAQILDLTGRHEEALDLAARGLSIDPLYHIGMQMKGRALFALGRYEEMIRVLEDRLVMVPDSDTSRLFLAAAHGLRGETERARTRWNELRAINPSFSVARARETYAYSTSDVMDRVEEGLAAAGIRP